RAVRRVILLEPVDPPERLRHLVADERTPELERGPVEEFARRKLGAARRSPRRTARLETAIDERENDHATAAFGEPAGGLPLCGKRIAEAGEILRELVRIGKDDHIGDGGSIARNEEEPFPVDVAEG